MSRQCEVGCIMSCYLSLNIVYSIGLVYIVYSLHKGSMEGAIGTAVCGSSIFVCWMTGEAITGCHK